MKSFPDPRVGLDRKKYPLMMNIDAVVLVVSQPDKRATEDVEAIR